MKIEVGKRYRLAVWAKTEWVKVLAVGTELFYAEDKIGERSEWGLAHNWLLVEEKRKFYPAIYRLANGQLSKSMEIFETEQAAMDDFKNLFGMTLVRWPSRPEDLYEFTDEELKGK